jgi:ribosomal protein L6P/L9E
MKWYGNYNYFNSKIKSNKNRNIKLNKLFKKSSFLINKKFSFKNFKYFLYLPSNWNFILFQKKNLNFLNLYMYNFNYFFILPFFKKFLCFNYDNSINVISLNFYFKNNFFSLFWGYFKILFFSFSKIFFKKLKFKGKGYYIYKNTRNTIALQFGYSHMMYIYSFFVTVKFITKTTILMFGTNYISILKKSYSLFNIKTINIFTGKGIRFSRQIIYKKTGKVSSYR